MSDTTPTATERAATCLCGIFESCLSGLKGGECLSPQDAIAEAISAAEADARREAFAEARQTVMKMFAALEPIENAIRDCPLGGILGDDRDTWNPDAHVEITITAAEVFAVQDALAAVCNRCEGSGQAHGADRPFESIGPGTYPGPCPVCGGNGFAIRKRGEATKPKETDQ